MDEFKNLKILIVDNNSFIAKTLSSILEVFGVEDIYLCNALKDAEKRFLNNKLDCIFVDFMTEDREGLEFIKMVRRKESLKNTSEIPVILYTGHTDMETITLARDAGISEAISKPFSPDQVYIKLGSAISNFRDFIDVEEFVGPNRRRHKLQDEEWGGDNDRRMLDTSNQSSD